MEEPLNENPLGNEPRLETERFLALGLVLLTIVSRLFYAKVRGLGAGLEHLYDDALITLRYSHNLAEGLGFVYNPGENALGTSSPLYALLMALPTYCGFDTLWSAVVFNLVCDVSVCLLLVFLARGLPLLQVLAPLFFLLHTNILYWSGTGMEFSLLILLSYLTIALFAAEKEGLAGFTAAVALIGRLDVVIVFAGFALLALANRRRLPWRFLAALTIGFLPWWLYSTLTFGSVVPLSAQARYLLFARPPWTGTTFDLLASHSFLIPALFGAILAWLPLSFVPPRLGFFLRVLSLHPLAFLLVYEASGGQIYRRYQVALDASLVVLAAWALAALVLILQRAPKTRRLLPAAALATTAFFLVRPGIEGLRYPWRKIPQPASAVHLEVGRWLRERAVSNARVMAGNIGYIGYFSGLTLIDSNGLVSPEVYLALRQGKARRLLLETSQPDYLALDPDEYAELGAFLPGAGYRLVHEVRSSTMDFVYRIFVRAPAAPLETGPVSTSSSVSG